MKPRLWLRGGGGELSEGIAVAKRGDESLPIRYQPEVDLKSASSVTEFIGRFAINNQETPYDIFG